MHASNREFSAVDCCVVLHISSKQTSWTEGRLKLEKDSLGRASNPDIEVVEREHMFRVHVDGLYNVCCYFFTLNMKYANLMLVFLKSHVLLLLSLSMGE